MNPTSFPTSSIQIKLERLDGDSNPVSPITSPYFDYLNATYVVPATRAATDVSTHRASWGFVHTIPDVPGPARLTIKAVDCAKNETIITRKVTVKEGTMSAPVLFTPVNGAVVNEKTINFTWDPVITAYRYDFELTRVSPSDVTTSTTWAIPFPTARYRVDLTQFAAIHPNGVPIEAGSIFGWRVRTYDVSDNQGEYSIPSYFTVDPNRPSVLNVLVNGISAGPTTIVSNGPVIVSVDFEDESGIDTSLEPRVTLSPMNPQISPFAVKETDFTSTTWTGSFNLPIDGVSASDPNGLATLTIGGFYDRAGNSLPETTAVFTINSGPWFDVKLFPNPVNPPELLFNTFSRSYENGPFVTVPWSQSPANPLVSVKQQGQYNWTDVSVYPMPSTTPSSAAFRGAYMVNTSLLGEVDFLVSGTDSTGVQSQRGFSINVVEALSREGVLFFGSEPGTHIAIPPVALTGDRLVYSVKEANGPALDGTPSSELLKIRSVGWFMPSDIVLSKEASIYASVEGEIPCESRQVGLYRHNGNTWEYCPTTHTGQGYTGKVVRLGAFALMADLIPPKVFVNDDYLKDTVSRTPTLVFPYEESGAGIDKDSVKVYIDERLCDGDVSLDKGR